jgi:predicted lipoprotein
MCRCCIAALAALLLAFPALAQTNKETLIRTAREFIIPRYDVLARATALQEADWRSFCAKPQIESFRRLKDDYRSAADEWSGIEFILYGPIANNFRFERMSHWPERKNAIGRAMTTLLARKGEEDLTPERFAQVSAAAQGITALERLLFEKDSDALLLSGTDDSKRRCAVATAIAAGLSRTSSETLAEWQAPDGPLAKFETGDKAVIDEAAARLATDYITLFEIIGDQKIGVVLGKDAEEARPTLAEQWRSARSMRAIIVNLAAAEALGRLLVDPGRPENETFFLTLSTARSIADGAPTNMGEAAADARQRMRLVLLRDAVRAVRESASDTIPPALGITLGFNSRDGD